MSLIREHFEIAAIGRAVTEVFTLPDAVYVVNDFRNGGPASDIAYTPAQARELAAVLTSSADKAESTEIQEEFK